MYPQSDQDSSSEDESHSDCRDSSDTDLTSDSDNDYDSDDDLLFDDNEEMQPPEYYVDEGANLDTWKLRSKRYSPNTFSKLERLKELIHDYCTYVRDDVSQVYTRPDSEILQFLKSFFSWLCDRRRGKGGRRLPGLGYTSSLLTSWRWFQLVFQMETGKKMNDMVICNGLDVVKLVAAQKELESGKRPSATMYVEDLAEFARVLLSTTQMTFDLGWQRLQVILFCQLAGITGNRPQALVSLRFRHLLLTLVRHPLGGRPALVIELTAEYTKRYLGAKDGNTFLIPEIIYDPTLVLSPHVFLLGMLFHKRAFKSESISSPEALYRLDVLDNLNQQLLPLHDDMQEDFVFCGAIREAHGVCIKPELQLSSDSIRYRMKKGGKITGFAQVTKPYILRDGAAKALNESPDVSDSLQNLILQHSSIDTFLKHYLDRNINVDVQNIYRGTKPQKELMRFVTSMTRSIDPRRPWFLTPHQTASINEIPFIVKLSNIAKERSRKKRQSNALPGSRLYQKWDKVNKRLNSEKARQRRLLLAQIIDRYNKEQPVIDSERQLSGMVVDEDTQDALVQSKVGPEQLALIDAILTLPATSLAMEYERRNTAIKAIAAYCRVEEGPPRRLRQVQGRIPEVVTTAPPETALNQAMASVKIDKRPTRCFICLGNPALVMSKRVVQFSNAGALSKHFLKTHVTKLGNGQHIDCGCCNVRLGDRTHLLIHAERVHGTVSRSPPSKVIA